MTNNWDLYSSDANNFGENYEDFNEEINLNELIFNTLRRRQSSITQPISIQKGVNILIVYDHKSERDMIPNFQILANQ
eukprot:CAMPEP_0114594948 /NCGR_PEP_ID=MMETSP0125-20121206/16646_1 /TAXON_ID=485358 ORGANISM="Aristerostoma sp., Strain ATCC 50986" /NCGR_SAMPLE_ID=MMETSP0125 /ASSEMBLY_ACC=CAM_ASM_000245 /LENGTH=77 /DNA_ID=CAMNT_0001795845 /DNA_START=12 /DNA_END=245 /DNA_ORIENTATION=+